MLDWAIECAGQQRAKRVHIFIRDWILDGRRNIAQAEKDTLYAKLRRMLGKGGAAASSASG